MNTNSITTWSPLARKRYIGYSECHRVRASANEKEVCFVLDVCAWESAEDWESHWTKKCDLRNTRLWHWQVSTYIHVHTYTWLINHTQWGCSYLPKMHCYMTFLFTPQIPTTTRRWSWPTPSTGICYCLYCDPQNEMFLLCNKLKCARGYLWYPIACIITIIAR